MIVRGKHDLAILDFQLEQNAIKQLRGGHRDILRVRRSQAACYVSQFPELDVLRNKRKVAAVKGPYLAKLIRTSRKANLVMKISSFLNWWRQVPFSKRGALPPGFSFNVIQMLESPDAPYK